MQTVKITIPMPGDAWQALGVVSLYKLFEELRIADAHLIRELELSPHLFVCAYEGDAEKKLAQAFSRRLQTLLNDIPLQPIELKLLNLADGRVPDENGWLPARFKPKYTLTKDQLDELKRDKDDLGRPKLSLKNPVKTVDMTQVRNFIGSRKNWESMREHYTDEIKAFFVSLHPGEKNKSCPLCGRVAPAAHFFPMNQSRNVMYNQHHNTKLRGFFGSVNKIDMCAVCNFLNLLATVRVKWIPYVVSDGTTHLLLPETTDLVTLSEFVGRMDEQLIDLKDGRVWNYRSNLRGLSHHTLYIALMNVYLWMQYTVKDLDALSEEQSPTLLSNLSLVLDKFPVERRHHLSKWLVPRYTKGQNVIFTHFTRIQTGERPFRLVETIRFGADEEREGNVVTAFFTQVRTRETRWVDDMARALLEKDYGTFRDRLFQLYKASVYDERSNSVSFIGLSFLRAYMGYLLTEIDPDFTEGDETVIDRELNEDLLKLGNAIGTGCAREMSLLTKLNNAPNVDAFRAAVKECVFALYKQLQENLSSGKGTDIVNVGNERIERIFQRLDDHSFASIRDTLFIYTIVQAFWSLRDVKTKEDESGKKGEVLA